MTMTNIYKWRDQGTVDSRKERCSVSRYIMQQVINSIPIRCNARPQTRQQYANFLTLKPRTIGHSSTWTLRTRTLRKQLDSEIRYTCGNHRPVMEIILMEGPLENSKNLSGAANRSGMTAFRPSLRT